MRVPQSWLADLLDEPPDDPPAGWPDVSAMAEAFVRVGLEIEDVHRGAEPTGPLVVGRVLEIEELTGHRSRSGGAGCTWVPTRAEWSRSGASSAAPRTSPRATSSSSPCPGQCSPVASTIAARETYGHVSDGMIASARELGVGADHAGILVLPPGTAEPGDEARPLLGADDPVIELNVTPDRGYCFAVRGLARELACALDLDYTDPAARVDIADTGDEAWPVALKDPGCLRFVARRVTGVDPTAPAPWWMQRRLLAAGMRPISLIVDVTNYVMLELGQPLHAYDAARLAGGIVVRRARSGERLTTLDDVERTLDPDDLLITDDSGPIGLAGVMGGAGSEIATGAGRIDVLLEAAHFDPAVVARAARRHKLPTEASRRFERTVDPQLPPVATERAAQLLVEHGAGTIAAGRTDAGAAPPAVPVRMPLELPDRVAGVAYPPGATVRRLAQVGCRVELTTGDDGRGLVVATPPSWRPDLAQPADLVEEVLRLEGLDAIPSVLPAAPPGHGLSAAQQRKRAVSRALAEAGYVEVLPFPFVGPAVWDALGLAADDVRRRTVRVLNPPRRRPRRARHDLAARLAGDAGAQPFPWRRGRRALPHRPGRPPAREAGPDARPGRAGATHRR